MEKENRRGRFEKIESYWQGIASGERHKIVGRKNVRQKWWEEAERLDEDQGRKKDGNKMQHTLKSWDLRR